MPPLNRRRSARAVLLALAALLTCAGIAFAAVGLTNPSFENDLEGWTAQTVREQVYEQPVEVVAPDCSNADAARRSVCIITSDTFTNADAASPQTFTVTPIDGTKMARLGGPFTSADQDQTLDRYQLKQSFTVDPENPVLKLNYNIFTYDYTGFDELLFSVRLVDEQGSEISQFAQGSFGTGTDLKTTGWQAGYIDLSGYENQTVHLLIDSGGTSDHLYGFWAYVDAGEVPVAPVSAPQVEVPEGVDVQFFGDENTGQTWINIPNSQVPEECLDLTINLPINAGAGVVSDVSLIFNGDPQEMTDADDNGTWTTVLQVCPGQDGPILVQYTLTEEGVSQTFLIPIGGLTLIDPAGVVYDKAEYDAAVAGGATADAARAAAAIQGAKVRLQRKTDGVWSNVLSGDPGISPNVNPETTGEDGRYAWDVEEGDWRVVVSADGYKTTTSNEVHVPPPVLDLHVAMESTTTPQPPDDDGDGVPNSSDKCPNQAAGTADGCPKPPDPPGPPAQPAPDGDGDGVADSSDQCPTAAGSLPNGCNPPSGTIPGPKKGACEGLTGTKLAACNRAQALAKKIATCNKIKNKTKRRTCVRKAKALAKCQTVKNKKKKAACVRKAKKIGAKKKKR